MLLTAACSLFRRLYEVIVEGADFTAVASKYVTPVVHIQLQQGCHNHLLWPSLRYHLRWLWRCDRITDNGRSEHLGQIVYTHLRLGPLRHPKIASRSMHGRHQTYVYADDATLMDIGGMMRGIESEQGDTTREGAERGNERQNEEGRLTVAGGV